MVQAVGCNYIAYQDIESNNQINLARNSLLGQKLFDSTEFAKSFYSDNGILAKNAREFPRDPSIELCFGNNTFGRCFSSSLQNYPHRGQDFDSVSFISFTRIDKNSVEQSLIQEHEVKDLHLYIAELKNVVQEPGGKNKYK